MYLSILGLAAISYYGMNDIENMEKRVARDLDVYFDDDDDEGGGRTKHY